MELLICGVGMMTGAMLGVCIMESKVKSEEMKSKSCKNCIHYKIDKRWVEIKDQGGKYMKSETIGQSCVMNNCELKTCKVCNLYKERIK